MFSAQERTRIFLTALEQLLKEQQKLRQAQYEAYKHDVMDPRD